MIEADRLIAPDNTVYKDEDIIDRAIRPKKLADYQGQDHVRDQMEIFIKAAQMRSEALDHLLIFKVLRDLERPHWLILWRMKWRVNIRTLRDRFWKKRAISLLCSLIWRKTMYFLLMNHRLSPMVEEVLYPAMEDYQLDIMIGEGPAARSIKIDLPPFTLIGATTRAGSLTSPLRDRFGITQRLEYYKISDLQTIVQRSADCLWSQWKPRALSRLPVVLEERRVLQIGCCAG